MLARAPPDTERLVLWLPADTMLVCVPVRRPHSRAVVPFLLVSLPSRFVVSVSTGGAACSRIVVPVCRRVVLFRAVFVRWCDEPYSVLWPPFAGAMAPCSAVLSDPPDCAEIPGLC